MKKITFSLIFTMLILFAFAQQDNKSQIQTQLETMTEMKSASPSNKITNTIVPMIDNVMIPVITHSNERDLITIGSGTSTQRQPFGELYGYERSASVYLSSEITTSGTVTQLRWYLASAATNSCPLKIYLKQTTSSSLTSSSWSSMISGATLVYEANVLFLNTGYNIINLTTSFSYNSGSNLLVLCETNYGGNGIGTYPTFRYTSSTSKHQQWAQDSSAPTGNGTVNSNRPNIQVQLTPTASNSINPTSLSFTSVASSQAVSVTTTGTWSISESLSWLSYSVTGVNSFNVTVTANNTGSQRSGNITLTFDNGSPTTITLPVTQSWTVPDPNGTPATATLLSLPVNGVQYDIDSESDIDWYKFNVTTAGTITIYTTRPSGSIDPEAWLYGPANSSGSNVTPLTWVANDDDSDPNMQPRIVYSITQTGYYFLRISSYEDDPTSGGKSGKQPTRGTGPYALYVSIGTPQLNSINPTSLSFTSAAGPQTVSVTTTGSWSLSEGLSWLSGNPSSGTGNGSFTITVTANTGTIRTGDVSVGFGTGNPAVITLPVSQAAPTPGEPNETPATATLLSLPVSGTQYDIYSESDIDWYKFNITTTGTITIYTTRPSGSVDPEAWLYGPANSNGSNVVTTSWIANDDDSDPNLQPRIVCNITQTGYYFLRISSYEDDPTTGGRSHKQPTRSIGTYALNISLSTATIPTIRLNVPYYYQGSLDWCTPTSIAMLMSFYGNRIDAKPWRIAQLLGMNRNEGFNMILSASSMINALNNTYFQGQWSLQTHYSYSSIQNKIIETLSQNRPLFIGLGGGATIQGHAIVVTGISDQYVWVNDPSGYLTNDILNLGEKVNARLTWAQFQYIASDWIGSLAWTVTLNATPQPQPSPISFQISDTARMTRNNLGGSHTLSYYWDGEYNNYGFMYYENGTWYPDHGLTLNSFTLADLIFFEPDVVNVSNIYNPNLQAKIKVDLYYGTQLVSSRTGSLTTLDDTDRIIPFFGASTPFIENNGSYIGNTGGILYQACQIQQTGYYDARISLLNNNNQVCDEFDIHFNLVTTNYAGVECIVQNTMPIPVFFGQNTTATLRVYNRGNISDTFQLYSYPSNNLIGTTPQISPNTFYDYQYALQTSSFPVGSTGSFDVKISSQQDSYKITLSSVSYVIVATDGNDTPQTATQLTLPVNGTQYLIDYESDFDWYKFNVSSPGQITIYTTRPSGTLDPEAWLYGPANSNGSNVVTTSWIANDDDSDPNLQPRIVYNVTQTGYYFLRISSYEDDPTTGGRSRKQPTRSIGTYALFVSVAPQITISGTITYNGNGLSGVTLNGFPTTTTTNASGSYSCTVNNGWSGTVTPALTGYSFTPNNRPYSNVTSNQSNQNYTTTILTYAISGTITYNGNGLSGVTLNGFPAATATNATGEYTCTVNHDWSGTVTPALAGYSFAPNNRPYSNVTSNQTNQTYTATLLSYSISGTITLNGAGLGGVTINGFPTTTTTNATGAYTCTVNHGWSGTVTPTLTGYSFTPSNRTYSNLISNQTEQNYVSISVPNDDPSVAPIATILHGNYPNPFNPTTTIRFSVKNYSFVTIDIYNIRGSLVKRLVRENKISGDYSVNWDGTDNCGLSVSSGTYYAVLNGDSVRSCKKMLLMK